MRYQVLFPSAKFCILPPINLAERRCISTSSAVTMSKNIHQGWQRKHINIICKESLELFYIWYYLLKKYIQNLHFAKIGHAASNDSSAAKHSNIRTATPTNHPRQMLYRMDVKFAVPMDWWALNFTPTCWAINQLRPNISLRLFIQDDCLIKYKYLHSIYLSIRIMFY